MAVFELNKVNINIGSYDWFMSHVLDLSAKKASAYICFANAHMLVEAWRENGFAEILNNASLVCPDGKPVAMLLSWFLGQKQDDLPVLCDRLCDDPC